jgi:hypothetical protein
MTVTSVPAHQVMTWCPSHRFLTDEKNCATCKRCSTCNAIGHARKLCIPCVCIPGFKLRAHLLHQDVRALFQHLREHSAHPDGWKCARQAAADQAAAHT